jgi:transposase InsO family protein
MPPFVIDVFSRMVVGWQISKSLRSALAIDALEMAIWNRTRAGQVIDGLIHHSDRAVQYLSIRYSERLAANDIVGSVGSRGDSSDNAMAESFNSLYKWELIYPQGPWRASMTSSTPPSATSTGSTTVDSTARSPPTTPTSPPPSSKPATTVKQHPPTRRSPNRPSSHGNRGGSYASRPHRLTEGCHYALPGLTRADDICVGFGRCRVREWTLVSY